MERVEITNTSNGTKVGADVLSRSDKKIRVIIDGMADPVNLTRIDTRTPYKVSLFGVELQTRG